MFHVVCKGVDYRLHPIKYNYVKYYSRSKYLNLNT